MNILLRLTMGFLFLVVWGIQASPVDLGNDMNFDKAYLTRLATKFGYSAAQNDNSPEALRDFLITNFADLKNYTNLGKISPFSFYQEPSVQAFKTNIPHMVLNVAISIPSQELPSVNAIAKFFGDLPYLYVFESSQAVLDQELKSHNFTDLGTCLGMVMDLDELSSYSCPPNIRVKRITGAADLDHWIDIVEKVQGTPRAVLEPFANALFNNPYFHSYFYLGFLNDVPVATSLITMRNDIVALNAVTTLAEYRNKGLGYAVSYQPLLDASNEGAKVATLSASDLGKPVYIKIGFREYCVYKIYGNLKQ